ncbi:MAG: hypothetical protein Q8R18_06430 [bacterium]|nr:hypothetical protein [bacterium]
MLVNYGQQMKFPPELTKEKTSQAGIFLGTVVLGEISKMDLVTGSPLELSIHNYGTDVLYPLGLYFFTRYLGISQITSIMTVATLSILSEISDTFDGGVYDPRDFLAYGLGLGIGYLIDSRISKKNTL